MENYDGYGKKSVWKWILIYIVIGGIIYALIYYFVLAKNGAYKYPAGNANPQQPTQAYSPSDLITQEAAKIGNAVTLTAEGFSPATLTIKAGDSVTWTNKSGAEATVNSAQHPTHKDYPPLNLGSFADGGTLTLKFDKAGTYKYHNHLNPDQTGTIIVQ